MKYMGDVRTDLPNSTLFPRVFPGSNIHRRHLVLCLLSRSNKEDSWLVYGGAWWKLIGWRNEAIAPPAWLQNHVDLSDYWKSGTWDIIEVPAYLNVHNDTGTFHFFPTTRPESPCSPPPPFRAEGTSCMSCWGRGNCSSQNWPVTRGATITTRQPLTPLTHCPANMGRIYLPPSPTA